MDDIREGRRKWNLQNGIEHVAANRDIDGMKTHPTRVFIAPVMLVYLCVAWICLGSQPSTGGSATPIVIEVNEHNGKLSIAVNDTSFTEQQMDGFLQQNKKQFGDSNPVFIRLSNDVSLKQMFELRALVEKTHHLLHFVVSDGKFQREIQISEPTPVEVPSVGDFMTGHELDMRQ